MESEFRDNKNMNILEIGVGDFEHLPFVKPNFKTFTGVDLRSPKNSSEILNGKINFIHSDAHKLPFLDNQFDRVIATCLIVHLSQPEEAIEEWLRVVKPGGKITIYIALEPSLFLQVLRKLYMKPKASKLGFQGYDLFIARDHITYGLRIINIIKTKYMKNNSLKFRPIPLPFWFINAFCVAEIVK
jgi:ubiquinone/menaquinone biosynthesis C-methylase UbiE